MNSLPILASLLGLSFASGVNLYAAVLIVGLGQRLGWIHGLPGDLATLSHPAILITAGVFYFLEFFADKIPYVSIAWDSIHTVIRPLGAAVLALSTTANLSPELQALAMLAGGTVALTTHSTKMGYRLMAHASPEPVSDSIFSLAEDAGVAGLVLLTYQHPAIAIAIVSVLLLAIAIILPFLLRLLRFLFHGLAGLLASLFSEPGAGNTPSPWLRDQLAQIPGAALEVRGFARQIPGVPRFRQGFLISTHEGPFFLHKGWFGTKITPLDAPPVDTKKGWIYDTMRGPGTKGWTLFITKDCACRT